MKGNTILITGGTSGIGLELAKQLLDNGNMVLICGRSEQRLKETKMQYPKLDAFRCDVGVSEDRQALVHWIATTHPECNVLINNAAIVHKTSFDTDDAIVDKAQHEVQTNFIGPLALSKMLLPLLIKNPDARIVNITTGLIYTPRVLYPVYNATKAALHSFTQVLRVQLNHLPIKVTEVVMTAVDTPWHQGTPPPIAIKPRQAVSEMIKGLDSGVDEVKISRVKLLYWLVRLFPSMAFRKVNGLK